MKMSIGSLRVSLGEKPRHVELGATGTVFFAGMLAEEEYNPDLKGEKAVIVYDKMRRSDGQVKSALLACELPLRAARWDVAAASEDDQDQKIAQFVRDNLFDQMTITWDDFLRHALLMFPFGFSVFEKVWELVGGKYRLRKLAPRLQKTIWKWNMDPDGGLMSIEQRAWKGGSYQNIEIPVEKLLVFTLGREGSNYTGISLLRAAYKHWYYKDQLYRIDGIAAERHGVGIAVFTLPSTATLEGEDSDYGKISKIGESLHTHERSYVALPDSYSFDLKGVAGQIHDTMKSIEHHDMQIVRSVLAQFVNLGAKKTGSYALSADQSGFFLMALQAVGKSICETVNRYAIPQLVNYNWDVKKYPKLTVSGLEKREMASYSTALLNFVNARLITPDAAIEEELRRFAYLPPKKENAEEEQAPEEEPEPKPEDKLKAKEFKPARQLSAAEEFVAFAEIKDKLDTAEEAFVKAAKEIQGKQIARIVDMVVEDIEKGELDKVATIDVPLRNVMADEIEAVLLDLYEFGQKQVESELDKQRGPAKAVEPRLMLPVVIINGRKYANPEELLRLADPKEFLRTRAKATSHVLGSKLRAAMAWEALRQIKAGMVDKAALNTALTALSDKELVATAKFSVSEALNFGRQAEAMAHSEEIGSVIYSALLDENTCGPCSEQDGKEYDFPSAEWDEVAPPYRGCEGQDRCRCVGVFIYKSEVR